MGAIRVFTGICMAPVLATDTDCNAPGDSGPARDTAIERLIA